MIAATPGWLGRCCLGGMGGECQARRLPLCWPAMHSDPLKLIAVVQDKFGPRAAITDPQEVELWLTDWRGRVHGRAAAILAPASTEEVAAIIALSAEHRVPLVP